MSQERIIVRISPDGTITAETKGMKGPKCLDSIALLEDLLDAETVSSAFTHEYTEAAVTGGLTDEVDDDLRQR